MELTRPRHQFHNDKDNRIQKLYYDVHIDTIFNRTKLQNIKNKFIKYVNYLIEYEKNIMQPEVLKLEKICERGKIKAIVKESKVRNDPTPENITKLAVFNRQRERDCKKCDGYITFQSNLTEEIHFIRKKIKQILICQHKNKQYKKCAKCDKFDIINISGCKSKHKLCSECISDKTECPVCKEDLGLVHCDICYEYKKELVDTGCENKHQTCKDCLDKIKQKNNKCPFCRGWCSKEPPVRTYVPGTYHTVEEMEQRYGPPRHLYVYERQEEDRREREREEEAEDRRESRREDMRESMRENRSRR